MEVKTNLIAQGAEILAEAGFSVLPTRSKIPCGLSSWSCLQNRILSKEERAKLFVDPVDGVACIGGAISRNLIMIDSDYEAEWRQVWFDLVEKSLPGLVSNPKKFYREKTLHGAHDCFLAPSGIIPKSAKLAHDRIVVAKDDVEFEMMLGEKGITLDEFKGKKKQYPYCYKGHSPGLVPEPDKDGSWVVWPCMVESKGTGGYCVVAPSPNYVVEQGSLPGLETLTQEEYECVMGSIMSLDQKDPVAVSVAMLNIPPIDEGNKTFDSVGIRPGSDYNDKATVDRSVTLLEKHGWSTWRPNPSKDFPGSILMTRPGKDAGVSGSLMASGAVFVNWSANAGLPIKKMSAFELLARLEYNGDFSAAARSLGQQGFGKSPEIGPKGTVTAQIKTEAEIIDGTVVAPEYNDLPAPPDPDELRELCRNTIFGDFVSEIDKVADVHPQLSIGAAGVLLSGFLNRCVRWARMNNDAHEPDKNIRFKPNLYVMLCAGSTKGKGTCEDAAMNAAEDAGIPCLDESSEQYLVIDLTGRPWGILALSELGPYLDKNGFKKALLDRLTTSFDGRMVSWGSLNSGKHTVYNSCPSVLAEVQPGIFLNSPAPEICQGLLQRFTVCTDPRADPSYDKIKSLSACKPDYISIHDNYRAFLDWLPPAMSPAKEMFQMESVEMHGGKTKQEKKGLGIWMHPVPDAWLKAEPYDSILMQKMLPTRLHSYARRLALKQPIWAIPFCEKKALKEMRITAEAQARADRLILSFFWSTIRLLDVLPVDHDDIWAKKVVSWITANPIIMLPDGSVRECTENDVRRHVSIGRRPKDFRETMEMVYSTGQVTKIVKTGQNGKPMIVVHAGRPIPREKLPRLAPLERTYTVSSSTQVIVEKPLFEPLNPEDVITKPAPWEDEGDGF